MFISFLDILEVFFWLFLFLVKWRVRWFWDEDRVGDIGGLEREGINNCFRWEIRKEVRLKKKVW